MKFKKDEIIDVDKGVVHLSTLYLFLEEVKEVLHQGYLVKVSLQISEYDFLPIENKSKYTQGFLAEALESYHKANEDEIMGVNHGETVRVSIPIQAKCNLKELEDLREFRGVKFLDVHQLLKEVIEEKVVDGDYFKGVYLDQEGSLVIVLEL